MCEYYVCLGLFVCKGVGEGCVRANVNLFYTRITVKYERQGNLRDTFLPKQ